jgi:hypothetical protein
VMISCTAGVATTLGAFTDLGALTTFEVLDLVFITLLIGLLSLLLCLLRIFSENPAHPNKEMRGFLGNHLSKMCSPKGTLEE